MEPSEHAPPPRVLLVCSGLDHAFRGFESFARDCFDVLRDDPRVDIELIKGSGPGGDRERSIGGLPRDSGLAMALGRASGREPFRFEQVAFALRLQPALLRLRPDVVYFSEWHTGLALAALRRLTRLRYALVLSNGTMALEGFDHLDRVQELTPAAHAEILRRGGDPRRHTMLPLGFPIGADFRPVAADERDALRDRLAIPRGRHVAISVAAINRHHKRIHYLIEEVASIPEPERPFLLVAGQVEAETEELRELAAQLLGDDGHSIRTVPQREVADLCRASDSFVLASLGEGLPRALIEGMSHGLPCLTHDYGVSRFALGEHGSFGDFTRPGALAGLLRARAAAAPDPDRARERHRFAYESFSWDRLTDRYVAFLAGSASGLRSR